jgi:hypothetical protein
MAARERGDLVGLPSADIPTSLVNRWKVSKQRLIHSDEGDEWNIRRNWSGMFTHPFYPLHPCEKCSGIPWMN